MSRWTLMAIIIIIIFTEIVFTWKCSTQLCSYYYSMPSDDSFYHIGIILFNALTMLKKKVFSDEKMVGNCLPWFWMG